MIKAIVFDCFGVLASDGLLPFFNKYFIEDSVLFEEANALSKQVDVGKSDYNEFIKRLAEMAKIPEDAARLQIEHNVPDAKLFEFIKEKLKPNYALGLLSNAGNNWLDEIFEPWQVALFDAIALSYENGFIKPDPNAYRVVASRLSVEPADCIMIDDQQRYITGAGEAGMQTILYTSFEAMQQELQKANIC